MKKGRRRLWKERRRRRRRREIRVNTLGLHPKRRERRERG